MMELANDPDRQLQPFGVKRFESKTKYPIYDLERNTSVNWREAEESGLKGSEEKETVVKYDR